MTRPRQAGRRRHCLSAEYRDPVLQRSQADPQHFRGDFAIAVYVLERELDVTLLDFDERVARLEHGSALMAG